MLTFLSLVAVGATELKTIDRTAFILSLAVVALPLYGEHMLDDTTMVGKPWGTVFSDGSLTKMAAAMFILAGAIGLYASYLFGSMIPILGALLSIVLCCLYGLELWRFHTMCFGALGIAAVPSFSYLAQTIAAHSEADPFTILALAIFGFIVGYLMLILYESAKTGKYGITWKMLALYFVLVYAITGAIVLFRLTDIH